MSGGSRHDFVLALMVSLICAASSSRLMAQADHADQSSEAKCEEAIAQKVKAAKKPETVTFANDAKRATPHGPLTHYAGKGSYVTAGGETAQFEWFCDVNGASGKPANLFYTVSKIDAPAKKAETPKYEAKPDKPWVQECQSVVESEIKKKNSPLSELRFHSAKVSRASNSEDLMEGEGAFGNPDKEIKFSYRCAYNVDKGKITAKSVRMK